MHPYKFKVIYLVYYYAAAGDSSFTFSSLSFGVSVGVLIAIILIITIVSLTVIAVLVRRNNMTISHQSESVDKISSSHAIDTDRNPAYEVVRLQTRNY